MEKIKLKDGLKKTYSIPCFQREYSWGEEEIRGLIDNIKDIEKNDYCLGVITTKLTEGKRILIDGQQRLTTLYLIAIKCGYIQRKEEILLTSEYNDLISKENNLKKIFDKDIDGLLENIEIGWKIIEKSISEDDEDRIKKIIRDKLYYYEINLDENTNINHYFEVMNSRGVQLSKSDIIKSFLMRKINGQEAKSKLNFLWYRLEKMEEKIFIKKFEEIRSIKENECKTINEILESKTNSMMKKSNDNEDENDSILDFDYFLLYAIELYKEKQLSQEHSGEFNVENLVSEYEGTFKNSSSEDIVKFLNFLINVKNTYNEYIIVYDNTKKEWHLKNKNKNIKLLQACMRVSFTNRKSMHWIYKTLSYYLDNKNANTTEYINKMRDFIRTTYIGNYIEKFKLNGYKSGLETPNIVLNYLDLLIKENREDIIKEIPEARNVNFNSFDFKFRNSIEHFMPRHKENSPGELNDEWVDYLGNLALLSYGTNTKMQNAFPENKAIYFNKKLSTYSLKLQIMTQIALKNNGWNEHDTMDLTGKCVKLLELDLGKNQNRKI